MITMLNTNLREQVVVLNKAWKYLATNDKLTPEDKKLVDDYGKSSFTNLAHYFHYLPELIHHNALYLMLPSDEKPFTIDTNTREIEVPPAFEKCGGVQSDNYSEIVTFVVDRYFDYKDLAEAKIAVQWINESANKEGVSFIDLVDLETYGDQGKLRFGWPLTAEMTAAAGNLRFAVRFYTATDNNGTLEFNYILNTAPKSILIKPTLSVDINNVNVVKNNADVEFFLNTVTRSQNPSYAIPSGVVFSKVPPSTAAILLEADESLGLQANELKLEAEAQTADGNDIFYDWYYMAPGYQLYVPYNEDGSEGVWPTKRPATKFYVKNKNYVKGSTDPEKKDEYLEFTEAWPETKPSEDALVLYVLNPIRKIQDNDDFTIKTDYNEYNPNPWPVERPLGTSFWVKDTSTTPHVYKKYGWNKPWPVFAETQEDKERLEEAAEKEVITTLDVQLYTHKSVLKFEDTQTSITGAYFVRGTNQITDFENNKVINSVHTDAPANYCWILSPIDVKIEKDKDLPNLTFLTTDSNTLEITVNNDDANPKRFYNVYYSDTKFTEKDIFSEKNPNGLKPFVEESTDGVDGTVIKYTIPAEQFGYYAIAPVVKLNRDESKAFSNVCTVSDKPGEVKGTMAIFDMSIPMNATDPDGTIVYESASGQEMSTIPYTWIETKEGETIDYDTVVLGDFDQNHIGGTITLSVPYTIINKSNWNTGDITYTWKRQAPDQIEEIIDDKFKSTAGDVVELKDNKLKIKWVSDSLSGISYTCKIANTIDTESEESKVFTFIIK